MTRALAFGDLHLEAGNAYGVLPGDRLRDQEAALNLLVDLAIAERVDVVLNGGDTFNGPIVTPAGYAAFQRPVRRLKEAGIPMIAISGNGMHDNALRDVIAPAVVQDVCDVHSVPGLRMIGDTAIATLPWCSVGRIVAERDGGSRTETFEEAAQRLIATARGLRAAVPTGAASILMLHFSISGGALPNGLPTDTLREIILPLEDLEALGFSAVMASHIHRPQVLNEGRTGGFFGPSGPIFYTSSLLPVDFSEEGPNHGAWIVETNGPGPAQIHFREIKSRPFIFLDCDLTEDGNEGVLNEIIYGDYFNLGQIDGAVVKVGYRATAEQAARVDHAALTAAILNAGASKVYKITATIQRDTRARVEGIDEATGPLDALDAWMLANHVEDNQAANLNRLTADYLDRLKQTTATVAGGVKPTRVRAINYRTFPHLDFELPTGVVALVGENGAGKSSIVNLIDVGLFAGRGEIGALLTTGEDDLELTVEFESAGEQYRARRGLRRGKSQTVDLERWGGFTWNWDPLSRENADATNQLITEIIGLSRRTFGASAFLRQGDGAAFTEAGAAARKAILVEVCGIEQWDGLLAFVRADVKAAEAELLKLAARSTTAGAITVGRWEIETRLAHARSHLSQADLDLFRAEGDLERAQAALAAVEAAVARVETEQARHDAAKAEWERIGKQVDEAKQAAQTRAQIERTLIEVYGTADRVPELETKVLELRSARARADAAESARAAALVRIAGLEDDHARRSTALGLQRAKARELHQRAEQLRDQPSDDQVCDRCEQHLGEEARITTIAGMLNESAEITGLSGIDQRELQALASEIETAKVALAEITVPAVEDQAPVEAELENARRAATTKATLTAQLETLIANEQDLRTLSEQLAVADSVIVEKAAALDEATAAVGDTDALTAAVDTARGTVTTCKAAVTQLTETIARDTAAVERIQAADLELATVAELLEIVQANLDILLVCARAYSRDGVPALIVENSAIPQIEERANWILGPEGFDTAYHVELRTQRELKGGDLTETLDIVVHDGVAERPYETFSGGERTRLNLALRVGLAELLAHRRGASSSLLVIDEPDFLDEAGIVSLVDILRTLTGVFTTILLVTHHPAGAASCDRQIRVVKDGDRSRIVQDDPPAGELAIAEAA